MGVFGTKIKFKVRKWGYLLRKSSSKFKSGFICHENAVQSSNIGVYGTKTEFKVHK